MNLISYIGKYFLFIIEIFKKNEKKIIIYKTTIDEIYNLGIKSISFVIFVSMFVGAVVTIQTTANMEGSWMPRTLIGYATRDAIILEFSPTIISLLLAGKVGSNIASSIGSMRITEQIDALEVMGVNPVSYLIRPKIYAMILFNPILISLSMIIGIIGGLFAVILSGDCTISEYVSGIKYSFVPYKTFYALVKTVLFAFIISSVSSFFGFNVKGGALEVGKSSTRAVVYSSVMIIVSNYILTQLLLS